MIAHQKNWYVLYTYPNVEKKISRELSRRSVHSFLPLRETIRHWWDRKKKLQVPLFPNYLFVHIMQGEMWPILDIAGVVRFVDFGGEYAVISEKEINTIEKITQGNLSISSGISLVEGEKVLVKHGPLAGMEGIVSDKVGEKRLIITIQSIKQALAVDISDDCIEKVT